jgi:hypothetical protein
MAGRAQLKQNDVFDEPVSQNVLHFILAAAGTAEIASDNILFINWVHQQNSSFFMLHKHV